MSSKKLSNRAIIECFGALSALAEKPYKKRQRLALKISRLLRKFRVAAREYEEDRSEIERRYIIVGEGDKNSDAEITEPFEYNAEIRELLSDTQELSFEPIGWDDFGDKFAWQPSVLEPLLDAGVLVGAPDEPKEEKKADEDEDEWGDKDEDEDEDDGA